jgi:hypothetical protein
MQCERCGADFDDLAPRHKSFTALDPRGNWCPACEAGYDKWVRAHASDIVWQALAGTVVIMVIGIALPVLGVGVLVGGVGAFAAFGTIIGLGQLNRRRRRRQFLQAPLPRAYLR